MQVNCDKCGKSIEIENGIVKEGIFSIDYKWGYFSGKDGETHSIDMCENCYDRLMADNGINVKKTEDTELI